MIKIKHFFFVHKGSERYINNVRKEKKERKKLPLLGFEPTPLNFNEVDKLTSLFEYSSKWR
jgi:hypothetical protein